MKTGLLLSVAFLFYGEANAACMPELDCASLGYKYSYSQYGGKGLACLYDSGKYFCPETVSSCSYTYTAEDCAAECKNIGSLTCSKNGKTYYASCGSSKCLSGQTCTDGYCKQSVEKQGYCCDDGEIYCGSGYTNCHTATSYPDCSDVRTSCRTAGGTPSFLSCGTLTPTGAPYAYFNCK